MEFIVTLKITKEQEISNPRGWIKEIGPRIAEFVEHGIFWSETVECVEAKINRERSTK